MKKVIIIALTIAASLLATSCKSGCGCPGGAGYGHVIGTEISIEANA
ncbi:MAG: hypothetical protein J6W49_04585 [Paludibacteraceae bacterium]|nr:hypothetical protein [Paludibacteraceae bacterium]MBP5742698.1 hypothetical protein [Paludibacteraceae bacterium]